MKQRGREHLFLLAVVLILVFPEMAQAKLLKVGVYDNAPIIFMDTRGRPTGFFIDLLEQIAAEENW